MRSIAHFVLCCLFVGSASPLVLAADSRADFFEKRIRPLFIKHCQGCHGGKKQEGGLRLDSRDGWIRGGDNGSVIIPGRPSKSRLIQAVLYTDSKLQMPPNGKKLSKSAIADLRLWIKSGAFDPRRLVKKTAGPVRMSLQAAKTFWSFQPIRAPLVPKAHRSQFDSPIDAFIFTRRQPHNVVAVGVADKRTLIRRATIDLTGLPPTPEDVAKFVRDRSPLAYDKLIERLLASPAYGVRWGRHWLDVARYADTAGDGADYPVREAGKYRDWVINALNDDQPFDQFIREQIAGDILAVGGPLHLYAKRVTATGFLAIGKRYGYKPSPDYQHLDFADVIDSVGRSILGLSLGCARCHDHKYDAISAADYYALYGIFQSTKWAFPGGEEHKRPAHFPSLVPPNEIARRAKAKTVELAGVDRKLTELKKKRNKLDARWLGGGLDLAFELQPIGKPPGKPWVWSGPIQVLASAQSPFNHLHPPGTRGIQLGSGKSTDGIRYVFKEGLRAAQNKRMHFSVDFRSLANSAKKGAYRFYLGRGVVQSLAVECSATSHEFAIRNGKKWEVIRKLRPGTWYTLRLTLDPATKSYSGIVGTANELTRFRNKRVGLNWDGVADTFICDAFGHVAGPACARQLDNIGLRETPFAAPSTKRQDTSSRLLANESNRAKKGRLAELNIRIAELTQLRKARIAQLSEAVAYGVSEGTPTNARIQMRGEPHRLGGEVPRRFLQVLGGDKLPAKSSGSGRLALANWLVRPSNPLTARVFVNRVWQWHFGQALVATPSDFGARGQRPTHPQLLDWLAANFVASGWSIKSLHRQIMRSRTYQLASEDHAANLKLDPTNRWYWRYSRRPLDAETIRDAMLAIAGRLDTTTPTPHPFPPVNTWNFTIHHPFHAVYDSNRRSVYLMVQRNRRHPYLALFDAADPNLSVAERKPTTTPTQALFLMNSSFVHKQAEAFAQRLLLTTDSDKARVRLAFEMAHGRIASEAVVENSVTFVDAYRAKLVRQGSNSRQKADLAAWAALARVIMTSNAFLYFD